MELYVKMMLYALVGAVMGYFCPAVTGEIVKYKCQQKRREIPKPVWRREETAVCILLAAVLFALTALCFFSAQSLFICVFCLLAIIGGLVDFRIRIIPNELIAVLFVLGLVFQLTEGGMKAVGLGLLGGIFTFVLFLFAAWITYTFVKSIGVGAGDVKLAAAIAFVVGLDRLTHFYSGIAIALVIYLLVGNQLGRIRRGSTFPMGVQIMAGMMVAFLLPAALPLF